MNRHALLAVLCGTVLAVPASAQKTTPILGPGQALKDLQNFIEPRLPALPQPASKADWEKEAQRLREAMFAKVIYRGAAAGWRDAKTKVEWFETIPGGPGYRLKKL